MADSNGVFVKLFRDVEEFERMKVELKEKRDKWGSQKEYRLQMAKAAGLVEKSLDAQVPDFVVDSSAIYPTFKNREIVEYCVWLEPYINNKQGSDHHYDAVFWPNIGTCRLPDEILEEMSAITELALFKAVRIFYSKNSWLLVGAVEEDEGPRHLIAYFGARDEYDRIQKKLEALRNLPPKPVEVKTIAEPYPVTSFGKWGSRAHWSVSE